MFNRKIYEQRRNTLRKQVGSGLIVLLGNGESPMNYAANPYHFRQDSHFLYFFGLDLPGFAGVLDVDENKDYLYGDDFTIDDIIWTGPQPTVKELAGKVGVKVTGTTAELTEAIAGSLQKGRRVHFLPPYRADNALRLSRLTGIRPDFLNQYKSVELIRGIVEQRSVKSPQEIEEIEKALGICYDMYIQAMKMAKPGIYEYEIVGRMEGIVGSNGTHMAFPTILSVHGETLHNHQHGNRLKAGDLMVIDSGCESPEHYASDITRTIPIGGLFDARQREIYEIVLAAQLLAIRETKPGKAYKDVHLRVATLMVTGLKDLGLMKGDIREAVREGAHALFYPHGLGHMMGLDVHDMEDIGEDFVGYNQQVKRSDQFGLAYLRLAKKLKPGYVFTVEPGIYFIPALIDQWKSEKKFTQFINYQKLESYRQSGGIRIEDDILVTAKGSRVLGKPIPKTASDIESTMK
jgi:Xaa-Pro aminopeptidase